MRILEKYSKNFKYNLNKLEDEDTNGYEEIEIDGCDIKHWLDTRYNAKEIVDFAKEIDNKIKENDLDDAYKVLVYRYDEIPEIEEYIEEEIYNSIKYKDMAEDKLLSINDLDREEELLDY